ncbi:sulfotransferase 4A1-like [Saccoglossus kowalevskii]
MNSAYQDEEIRSDINIYKGIKIPLFVPRASLEAMKNFEIRTDDVWLCTFAKSGTSWIIEIVWGILSRSGVFNVVGTIGQSSVS